jgi:hypothetical protein
MIDEVEGTTLGFTIGVSIFGGGVFLSSLISNYL